MSPHPRERKTVTFKENLTNEELGEEIHQEEELFMETTFVELGEGAAKLGWDEVRGNRHKKNMSNLTLGNWVFREHFTIIVD
jgi:hypothetical protein